MSTRTFTNLNVCHSERFSYKSKKKKLLIKSQEKFTIYKTIKPKEIKKPEISSFTVINNKKKNDNIQSGFAPSFMTKSNFNDIEEDNINGEYKIMDKLGNGNFCTVYKVKQYKTNEEYAAKVTHEDDDENAREENNYKIINTINSENIIKLITSGKGRIVNGGEVSNNRKYLILELCSKGDLFQYVYHGGKIKEIYCKVIFEKILLGVKELHEHGIYHMELKTPNIFLDENFNLISINKKFMQINFIYL
jgi:hypothetical protein